MARKLFFLLVLILSAESWSQQYGSEFEVGPLLNFQMTSLYVNNEVFNNSEGFSNSGYEGNYALGVYGAYYLKPKMAFGLEFYYDRFSSPLLNEDDHYNSLTLMPYFNYDPFRRIRDFYFTGGIGVAFIQEIPDYGSRVQEKDIHVITVPVKLGISYRIRNQFTAEVGGLAELLPVVDDRVRRNAFYLSLKVPLNRVFGGYR
ncbi:outer membrane beta-barrel protein [Gramella sp. GC03-9]|uniref:Outer membrane beta-barrel protein n=1 Tax=Christiangramia oceanisediminis TaxID=2920386 RepID=A0A9X2IAL6_9FLAO|nr:outer membrane beta-barrel protein [Gramella oceanisediminis]MCP9199143.1 outer membrane beta-barrel protein [Gramella oceanisediminis]